MILYSIFAISILINIVLIWYARQLLRQLWSFTKDVDDINESMTSFVTHLEGIYELETFYGDTTLQNLIRHSKLLIEEMKNFKNAYTFGEEGVEEDAAEEEQEIE
mgnify:FL=1